MSVTTEPNNYLARLFKVSGSRAAGVDKQRTLTWYVTVEEEAGTFTTHAGQLGGAIKPKVTKVKAKNVGRANETSLAQQAHLEAEAKWVKQVQRKLYKEDLGDGEPPLYLQCMLALDATKVGHRIDWGNREYLTQPKLNGVRFTAQKVAEGVVTLTSREGVLYTIPHIQSALNEVMPLGDLFSENVPLDGELYLGEDFELGDVTGALKEGTPRHLDLEAHVFDMVHPAECGLERQWSLNYFFESCVPETSPIKLVPMQYCSNMGELEKQHDEWAALGYEGIMLRDGDGLYDYGEKNIFMFKYKKFQDQEFLIVGVTPDKDELGGLFTMQTDNSEYVSEDQVFEGTVTEPTFTCRSKGTDAQRAHILANPDEYIGKLGTIRFSSKLKTGVPEFNRCILKDGFIAVRDYE